MPRTIRHSLRDVIGPEDYGKMLKEIGLLPQRVGEFTRYSECLGLNAERLSARLSGKTTVSDEGLALIQAIGIMTAEQRQTFYRLRQIERTRIKRRPPASLARP